MAETETLEKARGLIEDRLKELDEERKHLEQALGHLVGGKRGPGRPRGSRSAPKRSRGSSTTGGKRRRRRRGGTRGEQALKLVTESPGIGASAIAEQMKIKPNYVYRVMSDLQEDGKVTKQGRNYFPAGSNGSTGEASEAAAS